MAERLRVLRVMARTNVGGPSFQLVSLARGLDPARFDHRVLAGFVDEDEADHLDLRAPDVAVTRVPGLGRAPRPFDDARALRTLVRELRAFRPHIVHTHTAKAGVLGRIAAITARVPLRVHTFHGHLLHGYFSPGTTRAVVATERLLAQRTTRLVAVGQQVRDDLLAAGIGSTDQYVVVPPGVDLPDPPTRAEARGMLGVPGDAPAVAFVARMTAIKRPDRFAEVVRRIDAARPDLHVLVAGGGAELAGLRRALAPLGDRAHFLGFRPDVEVVHAAADVTLLTSDNEGMPVSLIEAAWCGRPTVTTDVGSAREVVVNHETGLVCEADARVLAEATMALLADPALARAMGEAAQTHARRAFSADRLVRDTSGLYEHLVALGPRRTRRTC